LKFELYILDFGVKYFFRRIVHPFTIRLSIGLVLTNFETSPTFALFQRRETNMTQNLEEDILILLKLFVF
jgi:hypothetical protein